MMYEASTLTMFIFPALHYWIKIMHIHSVLCFLISPLFPILKAILPKIFLLVKYLF